MRWSDIPFRPTSRTLRQFAGLWIVFFLAMAAWQGWHHQRPVFAAILGIVAVTVGLAGLIRPSLVRPIYVGWMVLAFPIGWTLSHLLLAVVFFGVVTPVGFVLRLVGHDALCRRWLPERESYWEPRPEPPASSTYFRQF